MAMTGDMLTIGQVADAAGLKTSAIRFYEARGLLPKPVRVGGQRRYTEQTLQRLAFLDVAKRAGCSLEEARLLFDAADQGAPAHAGLRELAEQKIPDVEALIERAQEMKRWLNAARDCGCATLEACGLFATDTLASSCDPDR
jgi:MerR family redox-sensitive transcriptional activator SoxR